MGVTVSVIEQTLKLSPAFKDLNSQAFQDLLSSSEQVSFPQETCLIAEEQSNTYLYVLVSGVFHIRLNGETVNLLEETGEVVGEMGWLLKRPAIASVFAAPSTEAVRWSFTALDRLDGQHQGAIRAALTQAIPAIASERLKRTNHRAKEVNRLVEKVRVTEEQLRLLNQSLDFNWEQKSQKVEELLLQLKSLLPQLTGPTQEHVKMLIEQMGQTLRQNQVPKKIKIAVQDKKLQHLLSQVAGVVGFSESAPALASHDKVLCVKDWPSFQSSVGSDPQAEILLVVENPEDFYTLAQAKDSSWNHLCWIPTSTPRSDKIKLLSSAFSKILFSNYWGIRKYLSWGSQVSEYSIQRSDERSSLIFEVSQKLQAMKVRKSILARIEHMLEELLMNALFDAPTDHQGHSRYNHLPRTDMIQLSSSEAVQVQVGSDGMIVALSVLDPFGSLDASTLVRYVTQGMRGQFQQDPGKGGAGKGLFLVLSHADQVVYNMAKGQKTEAIVLFRLESFEPEHAEIQNSLQIFKIE